MHALLRLEEDPDQYNQRRNTAMVVPRHEAALLISTEALVAELPQEGNSPLGGARRHGALAAG